MRYFVIIATIALLSTSVHSASFDCKKASTDVEKTICSDNQLSKLDEELGKLYKSILNVITEKESLKSDQKKWMQFRNTVLDNESLIKVYKARIDKLKPMEPSNLKKITIVGEVVGANAGQWIGEYELGNEAVVDKIFKKCSNNDICKVVAFVSKNDDIEIKSVESVFEVSKVGTIVMKIHGKLEEKNDNIIKKNQVILNGKVGFGHNPAGGNFSFYTDDDQVYAIKQYGELASNEIDMFEKLGKSNKYYTLICTLETTVDGYISIDSSSDIYIVN